MPSNESRCQAHVWSVLVIEIPRLPVCMYTFLSGTSAQICDELFEAVLEKTDEDTADLMIQPIVLYLPRTWFYHLSQNAQSKTHMSWEQTELDRIDGYICRDLFYRVCSTKWPIS